MRIHLMVRVYESRITADSMLNLGLKTGFGNDMLMIGEIKITEYL